MAGIGFSILVVGIFIAVVWAMICANNNQENKNAPKPAPFIIAICVSCSKNTWTIKGYVDAQNGFGAMLRSDFTVKITFTGNSSYTVDLCSIS